MDTVLGILGATALRVGGALVEDWGPPRQRAVLGLLAYRVGRWVPVEQLLDWVWAARPPDDPQSTLEGYAAKIRTHLKGVAAPATISGRRGRFRLDVDPDLVDFHRFRRLADTAAVQARAGDPAAEDTARQALALWRGDLLDDLTTPFADGARATHGQPARLTARRALVDSLLARGAHQDALSTLLELQEDEGPHDVEFAERRITALRGLGRQREATTYYLGMRKHYLDEGDPDSAEQVRAHHDSGLPTATGGTPVPHHPVPRGLPVDSPDFTGRADLLAELDVAAGLADGDPLRGVLVLDGMPGVGKSALAAHWGHRAQSRFNGGSLHVDLDGWDDGGVRPRAAVVDELLLALGRQVDGRGSPQEREVLLRQALADRHTLVVLDGVRDREQVKDLIKVLADCLVLITTRQRITSLTAWSGARRVHVPPLSPAESAELAARRFRARPPGRLAEDLLAACGGLPLVVNLAVEHVVAFGAGALSADPARLLDLGGEGFSVASITGHTHRLLGGAPRRAFGLLGLHPGADFGAEVAASCTGLPLGQAEACLSVLVDAHLLQPGRAPGRYRFHGLLREFARRRAGEEDGAARSAAVTRVVDHYLQSAATADELLDPGTPKAPRLAPVPGAVRAALPDAAAAARWLRDERANVIAVLRLAADTGDHARAWRLAHAVGTHYDLHGCYQDSLVAHRVAIGSARADGHREAESSSSHDLGVMLLRHGELEQAREHLDRGRRFAEEHGPPHALLAGLLHLGLHELRRGRPAAAVPLLERCLALGADDASRAGHTDLAWVCAHFGEVRVQLGQPVEAEVLLHQGRYHAEMGAAPAALAACLHGLARVHRVKGDLSAAESLATTALAGALSAPHRPLVIAIRAELAQLHEQRGALATAQEQARQAVADAENAPLARADALRVLGRVMHKQGKHEDARAAWTPALAAYVQLGDEVKAAVVRAQLDMLPHDITLPLARSGDHSGQIVDNPPRRPS
ncbi:AfsR/SARP family transcriptional regulator [Actinokineospora bangkokensis]|uniref:AfsR/SARP family transcriptional regulator n=1 Tax=Actinokineospora bangkokensis TaxID=1193682 RepID=UPI000AC831F1|nr:BTAD domain-containing putative transcriptional regulator [Actinokineospora bangkokensis]